MTSIQGVICRCAAIAALALQATQPALADGPQYTITDLGPIGPNVPGYSSSASAINNSAQVAGVSTNTLGDGVTTCWLPEPDFGFNAGPNDIGAGRGRAYGISDAGHLAGFQVLGNDNVAFVWSPMHGLTSLGTLGGSVSIAHAVNSDGWVVGRSTTTDPDIIQQPFLHRDGQMIDLGNFGGVYSSAEDINELGQIVGRAQYPAAPGDDITNGRIRAFMWLPEPAYGMPAGLNDIDPDNDELRLTSHARGVNDKGQVVGWVTWLNEFGQGYVQFGIWLPEPDYGLPAGWTDLRGVYGQRFTAFAQDINNRGDVVFRADRDGSNPLGDWGAFLWRQGVWYDLIDCIPPADQAQWYFGSATDINDKGEITGWGSTLNDQGEVVDHAFLLTPVVPETPALCRGDLNGDATVDLSDLNIVLLDFECGMPGGPLAPCAGDVNDDDVTNLTDLNEVLLNWGTVCQGDPAGACCFPATGDCQVTTQGGCDALGGTWQMGNCETVTCAPPAMGACCLYPSGDCVQMSELLCLVSADGEYQGDGSDCGAVFCPVPMQGDRIEDPFIIASIPFDDTGSTVNFENDYDVVCDWTSNSPDVVFKWEPTEDMTVRITNCDRTAYDSKLFVYENDEDTVVACNDDHCTTILFDDGPWVAQIDFLHVTAGNTYYIVQDGWGGNLGFYSLEVFEIDLGACCLPDGGCEVMTEDTCVEGNGGLWQGADTDCTVTCPPFPTGACCVSANCIAGLTEWDCTTIFGGEWRGAGSSCSTADCTAPPGDRSTDPIVVGSLPYSDDRDSSVDYVGWHSAACGGGTLSDGVDVFYTYTPTADETVTISMCRDTSYDSELYVYEDAVAGEPYACNRDACTTPSFPLAPWIAEITSLSLRAGHTYYIVVDAWPSPGNSGPYTLDITVE